MAAIAMVFHSGLEGWRMCQRWITQWRAKVSAKNGFASAPASGPWSTPARNQMQRYKQFFSRRIRCKFGFAHLRLHCFRRHRFARFESIQDDTCLRQ